MSEKTKTRPNKKPNYKLRKGAAIGAAAVAAVAGLHKLAEQPAPAAGHDKLYIAKPGDTEWGIAQRAYPDTDPRIVTAYINEQEPAQDRQGHLVVPGDKFYFASDARIGDLVEVGVEAKSLDEKKLPPPIPAG